MSVDAKEDSFSMAKQRMAQLENQNKKSQAKEIGSRKRTTKPHLSQTIPERNISTKTLKPSENPRPKVVETSSPYNRPQPQLNGSGPSPPIANQAVLNRTLRERIIHLLALRSYQRPELLLRLQRDGLSSSQKAQLDEVLSAVGRTGRQFAYDLLPSVIPELNPNWPGYSGSERARIIALKAKHSQTSSPMKSPPNRSRNNSPANALSSSSLSVPVSVDQFARRPTRANAPTAPHGLNKKIAALDMLAAGVNISDVASRVGVCQSLLENWRANETELRQKFMRQNPSLSSRRGSTPDPNTDRPQPHPVESEVPDSETGRSQLASTSISPVKRARNAFPSHAGDCTVNDSHSTQIRSFSGHSNSVLTTDTFKPDSRINLSFPALNSELLTGRYDEDSANSALRDTLVSDPFARQSQYALLNSNGGAGVGAGSEGECSDHTPLSNASTGSSGYGGSINGNTASTGNLNNNSNNNNNNNRCGPANHDRISTNIAKTEGVTLSRESKLFNSEELNCSKLSAQCAKIDLLFPPISSTDEVSAYRAEFESTYPTYLRMYHSFSDVWRVVEDLRNRLLNAAETQGLDSPITTSLADKLDSELGRVRTPQYRNNETQLILMTHKLKLLKQRLSDCQQENLLSMNTKHSITDLDATEPAVKSIKMSDGQRVPRPNYIANHVTVNVVRPK